ncbi:hypothetical protein [Legionella fallonii]|uniref:Putative Interaptin n=1 Tax=Legionella fallonii LLAP-10 TaxID=1212491 RepID=A0A098G6S2_9GAMM|nr:hypothetical protein [Legionella fallonii]CEG57691.1 putative Interaptin [Legionella fallonii LLAP-10]
MPRNKQFLDAVQNIITQISEMRDDDPLRAVAVKERDRALDAVLRVGAQDVGAFRAAIRGHEGFWRKDPALDEIEDMSEDDFIVDRSEEEDSEEETTFEMIHQEVAKQRVMLGLQGAEEDVLIAILKNNSDECRAYLAQKGTFGPLARASGWQSDTVAPVNGIPKKINKSTNILPDENVAEIQAAAARLLLIKRIEKSNDAALLEALKNSSTTTSTEFADAARDLGFPDDPQSLTALSTYFNTYAEDDLDAPIDERINKVQHDDARTKYKEMVNGWSDEKVLAQKSSLEQSDEDFKEELNGNSDLDGYFDDVEDVQWAKGIAGQRFLQAYLPANCDSTELLTIINADGVEDTVDAVKTLLPDGDQNYIEQAIKEESLAAIKASMVQGVIQQNADAAKIKALIDAKNLDTFKKALRGVGVTQVDWLTDEAQMLEMQKTARTHKFELAIGAISTLDSGVHSKLVEAFNTLEPEKQDEILANNNNEIRHLVNAQDTVSLKHYFGDVKGDDNNRKLNGLLIDAVNENKRNAFFKGIHNAEVAKILQDINPPIQLDATKVAAINTALKTHGVPLTNFDTPATYKALVDKIHNDCVGGAPNDEFYNQFGLDDTGAAFQPAPPPPNSAVTAIKTQESHNKHLIARYNDPTTGAGQKALLDVLLSAPKSKEFAAAQIDELKEAFGRSSNLAGFLEAVAQKKSDDKVFVNGLTNQLTSTKYNVIRVAVRKANLTTGSLVDANSSIDKLNEELETIQEHQKNLDNKEKDHRALLDVQPIHLFNPSFREKARQEAGEMKPKYQEMAKDCALILDELRRDKLLLKSHLESLPTGSPPHANPDVAAKITKLRNNVNTELEKVDERLTFYTQVQEKLIGKNGILKAIDRAVDAKESYYYDSSEITRHRRPINQPRPLPTGPVPHNNNPTTSRTSTGKALNFLLDDKLEPDEAMDHDVTHETIIADPRAPGGSRKIVSFGRYSESHPDTEPGIVNSNKDGSITRRHPSKFVVEAFPQKQPGLSDKDLEQARVKFSMNMANSILANMDGPPSKENKIYLSGDNAEELRYLWTALVTIGEKDPNMKFDRDCIEVDSPVFNPESERDSTFGISYYAKDSLYKTVFKENETLVNNKIGHIEVLSQEKLGHKKEASEIAEKSMKSMKSTVQDWKHQPETLKTEGAAAEVEVTPPSPSVRLSST